MQRHALEGPRNVRVQRRRPGGRYLEPDPNLRSGASGGGPPTTKITKAKIKSKRKKATFKFTAGGQATGFECQLTRKHHRAPDFKKCHSPKVYKHLKRGNYTFKVRAVGPGGTDATPARKSFKIKKQGAGSADRPSKAGPQTRTRPRACA